GAERPAAPGGLALREADLVPRSARDVVERGRIHHLAGDRLEVVEAHDVREIAPNHAGRGHPTRSRFARLASIVLRPTAGSLNATVISSSLRVSLLVTTIPSPHRACRTRSPSRYWRSPGMIARGGRAGPPAVAPLPCRASDPDGAPASNASRLAARSRLGRNASPSRGAPGTPLPWRYAGTERSAVPRPRGRPNRVVPRAPNARSRSTSRPAAPVDRSGPIISSAGISSRNREGSDAWPIPHVARRQAWDRYSRRMARVIPTYARRRSSSSSFSSSSARLCGNTPS